MLQIAVYEKSLRFTMESGEFDVAYRVIPEIYLLASSTIAFWKSYQLSIMKCTFYQLFKQHFRYYAL